MFQFLRLCAALLVVAAFPICVNAQTIPQQSSISDPGKIVKWSYSAKETAANEYDLLLTATIQKDWTVYSQNLAAGGPVPTSFRFDKTSIQTVGAASENSEHTKNYYEPVFKMQIIKYADRVTFVQHIKALKPTKIVTGSLRFMTCNDRTCLPPSDLSFSISLPAPKVATVAPIASAASNSAGVRPPRSFRTRW